MQLYSYSVSLRIWHPKVTPEVISKALGIQPNRSWEAGARRTTPKGTLLEGTYKESYWNADPFERGECSSTDEEVEDVLLEVVCLLEPKHEFLLGLRSSGARILVHVSSFSARNYALELSPDIMGRFSSLGVSLAHDVYPHA